ncbi:MAG: DUF4352 domain-containing protein, partial [Thaumarchaeota archaeon]|nr:DUF4352 domain-containing protein [Nitrososphaerota archaeon]
MRSTTSRGLSRAGVVVVVIILVFAAGILTFELWTNSNKAAPRIQVDRVSLDQVDAPSGNSFYVLELNVSNAGTAAWKFNPGFLELVSNESHLFTADSSYNATSVLEAFSVGQNGQETGRVAYELPARQIPSSLRYTDSGSGIDLNIGNFPQVSAVASRLEYNVRLTVNGLPVDGWTAKGCPSSTVNGTSPWACSLIVNGVILNNSLVFLTGQNATVNLWFEYLRKPADPTTVRFESVTAGNGFQIISVDRKIPFELSGWADQAGVVLLLGIPPGQQSGSLDLALR